MVMQPEIIGKKMEKLRGVKAILLYGSFARGEADELSDLDVMVIVEDSSIIDAIREELKGLDPIITTEDGIMKSVKLHPSTVVMLKEARPIYGNPPELPEIRKEHLLRELDEALKILEINEALLSDITETTTNAVIYSAILRARQAYIIKCLIRDEAMTKRGFIEELKRIGIKPEYYDYYRLARDDKLSITLPELELKRLVKAVKRYVKQVRKEVKKL